MNKNLLKCLYQCLSENSFDALRFLSLYPDTPELRAELKVLEDFGYIHVVYSSGEIFDVDFSNKGIDFAKTL